MIKYMLPVLTVLAGLSVIGSAGYLARLQWQADHEPPPPAVERIDATASPKARLESLQRQLDAAKHRMLAQAEKRSRRQTTANILSSSAALMFLFLALLSYRKVRGKP